MPAPQPRVRVVAVTEDDWERVRDLRLEMLADTPDAYVETLEHAREQPEAEWRFRARRSAAPGSTQLVAVDAAGAWVGTMAVYVAEDDRAWLVGVYVAPASRGRAAGIADALLDGIEDWARTTAGASALHLEVHEDNARAQAFYLRRGWAFTGATTPYPLDATQLEREMVLSLR